MTVGKQFEKNFAMICFLLSPSGGKRKTHFSLQNSERPFCLPTVTHSPPVSAIMALNIMYRQKKTDGNRPRLPSVSVAFLCILHNPLFMIRVVGLCNMLKLTIFQRKSQNIIDIYRQILHCGIQPERQSRFASPQRILCFKVLPGQELTPFNADPPYPAGPG